MSSIEIDNCEESEEIEHNLYDVESNELLEFAQKFAEFKSTNSLTKAHEFFEELEKISHAKDNEIHDKIHENNTKKYELLKSVMIRINTGDHISDTELIEAIPYLEDIEKAFAHLDSLFIWLGKKSFIALTN